MSTKKPASRSQTSRSRARSASSQVSIGALEAAVFRVDKKTGKMYIGGEEINDTLRSLLRDDAQKIQVSRLWEILNASVIDEAYHLALIQSTDWDNVQFAKALHHWSHFMVNVIHQLAKNPLKPPMNFPSESTIHRPRMG